ncbi:hypothetical protein G9C98_000596 [Cotesia typhae]|uniref:BTB domain-containing protein n=1 Tax=Cotesia typhae TaxID=2053667 RepID=A0A8J5R037_9HYME|nr:hypothetical protein G9C98_000596 [Cotesia typhae]
MALMDDVTSEEFVLRWNNFSNNLSDGFLAHLSNKDLVDVTLAVEGRLLQAHKLILSVCSPYFHEILKANPCEHPVIILKDIKYHDIEALINFMYQGEVNVKQDELENFLTVAEILKVNGLTFNNDVKDLDEFPINGYDNPESEVKSVKPKERSKKRAQDSTQPSKKVKRSQELLKSPLKTDPDKDQDENDVDNSVHHSNVGPVTYRLSARGRPQLVYEGFVYNLTSRSEVLNRSHYRCAEQHRGCRGKCAVISERFMPTGVKDHNHLPGYLSEEDYRKKKSYED